MIYISDSISLRCLVVVFVHIGFAAYVCLFFVYLLSLDLVCFALSKREHLVVVYLFSILLYRFRMIYVPRRKNLMRFLRHLVKPERRYPSASRYPDEKPLVDVCLIISIVL